MPFKDPEAGRAYRAARHQAKKADISAKAKTRYQQNKAQILAKNKRYRQANRAKILARQRAYNQLRRAENSAKTSAWYRKNKPKAQAYHRQYHVEHPDKAHENKSRRRARILQAPLNDLTAAQWREIKAAYDSRCVYCHRQMQRLTQDHLTPLSKGGSHTASNVVPACLSCNCQKYTGPPLVPVQPLLLTLKPAKKKAS